MKLRCLDNERVEKSLTVDKVYEEIPPPHYPLSDTVWIMNDEGRVAGYYKKRFKEIQDDNRQE